ncbi:MAG: hypothetical protein ABT940_13920 [Alphaproteobacteria bacterium]
MKGIAPLLAIGVGLAGALLYLIGWGFAAEYYARFGLGLAGFDIPREYFFAWGMTVLMEGWGLLLIGWAVPVCVAIRWGSRAWQMLVWSVCLVGLAWSASSLAHRHGRQVADNSLAAGLPGLPNVELTLREDGPSKEGAFPAAGEADLRQQLKSGCWRLLIQDRRRLWLIRPVAGVPDAWPAVDMVPLRRVVRMRVLPRPVRSCD